MKSRIMEISVGASLAAILAGCGPDQPVEAPETDMSQWHITESAPVTWVGKGESAFIGVTDPESPFGIDLIRELPRVDSIYPENQYDAKAPLVTSMPMRVQTLVSVSGESPKLDNDAGCDTLRVEGDPERIGAVALGGNANGVMLVRPDNPSVAGAEYTFAYLCSFHDQEPQEGGTVIFSSEE